MKRLLKIFDIKTVILYVILSVAFTFLIRENRSLSRQIDTLTETSKSNAEALNNLARQRTIALQIQPTINNRIQSNFGSTREVTMQYYFTIDGNSVVAAADSIHRHTFDRVK